MSYRLLAVAMSSIPQHAVANGMGQRLCLRTQLARAVEFTDEYILVEFHRHSKNSFAPGVHVGDGKRDQKYHNLGEQRWPKCGMRQAGLAWSAVGRHRPRVEE